jgi:hypothetical protein
MNSFMIGTSEVGRDEHSMAATSDVLIAAADDAFVDERLRSGNPPRIAAEIPDAWHAVACKSVAVATFSYLPYAVFNFASPLLAIVMTFPGVRMRYSTARRPDRTEAA